MIFFFLNLWVCWILFDNSLFEWEPLTKRNFVCRICFAFFFVQDAVFSSIDWVVCNSLIWMFSIHVYDIQLEMPEIIDTYFHKHYPNSEAIVDYIICSYRLSFPSDGRFLDDSWVNAPTSKSSKSRKEKSRSPLRVTTLESNIRKNNRVEFREPLVSYRLVFNSKLSTRISL